MRLTEHEVSAIKAATREAFGVDAVARLFRSRVHDGLRGGDIDLLIEVDDDQNEWRPRGVFEERSFALTEPRRVNVLVGVRGRKPAAIQAIARRDGIAL